LDVGARLIGVDLQEQIADSQGHALVMGDDDLDLFHVSHLRGDDPKRQMLTFGGYPVRDGIGSASPVATSSRCSWTPVRTMLEPSADQERPGIAPMQHACSCPSFLRPEPSGWMSQAWRTNGSP